MCDSRDIWGLFFWNENGIKDGEPGPDENKVSVKETWAEGRYSYLYK